MPRLPVVSGREVLAFMQSFGYGAIRQRGSHIRVEMRNERGVWTETIPDHKEVSRGVLRSILRRMSAATGNDENVLIERLAAR